MLRKGILLLLVICLCFSQSIMVNAKVKKEKISQTKITMVKGSSHQLKIQNKKQGGIKWYSSNKKRVKISKKGIINARKVGKATVYAKVKNRKYKCTVVVKNKMMSDKIQVSNSTFTKELYKKVCCIRITQGESEINVISPKGIYKIYSILAGMNMNELPENTPMIEGGTNLTFVCNDGEKINFTLGSVLVWNQIQYNIPSNIASDVVKLVKQYSN